MRDKKERESELVELFKKFTDADDSFQKVLFEQFLEHYFLNEGYHVERPSDYDIQGDVGVDLLISKSPISKSLTSESPIAFITASSRINSEVISTAYRSSEKLRISNFLIITPTEHFSRGKEDCLPEAPNLSQFKS